MDDELHLTVKRYNYPFRDRHEIGVASDYLINLQKNAALRIYPHRNARFHLPEKSDAPLILVADGTGIAPFRAFVQEMKAGKLTHPCWLIFSEQRSEEHTSELQSLMRISYAVFCLKKKTTRLH